MSILQTLQRRLMALGFPLPKFGADGSAGAETVTAVNAALDELEVLRGPAPADEARPFYVGAARKLTSADFARIAAASGIEEAKIRAVAELEAAGSGFHSSGALVCLYEPHIAWRYSAGAVRAALAKEGLAYEKWKAGGYPRSSLARIDRCAEIAGAEVACLATSWGLGQIMGFNHQACGFSSALVMVKAFAESEGNQVEGMIRFIRSNAKMLAALQKADWAGFAALYNGAGYKTNKYDTKLAAAYARYKKG